MMKDFTKRILLAQEFYPEFFFHVLHSASSQNRYHVSACEGSWQKVFFTMERRDNGSWKIIDAPKVPDWVLSIEKRLEEAIVENLETLKITLSHNRDDK